MSDYTKINAFLGGAITVAALVIALFFARFRRATREGLFGYFSAAFLLMGLERLCLEFLPVELQRYVYLIRLCAFVLILFGIWEKNRKEKRP